MNNPFGRLTLLAATLVSLSARAQMGDPTKVNVKVSPVANGVSMIEGVNGFAGGNVAVTVGDDGLFVIDDELAPLTPKLKAALATLSKKPVRLVVNTHFHQDHTGGNPALGAAGAVIIAQENVRKRLSVDQVREFMGKKMTMPALPAAGLPVVTFTEDVTLHVNGDDVHVVHVPPAHTDGDSIVHFTKANVIHTGDVVGMGFPLIDVDSGGTFDGFITAADKVLALADDNTKIVPGHGPVMTKADVAAFRQMLIDVRDRLEKLMAAKKTADDAKAAKPLADLEAKWGQGFIHADMVIDTFFKTHTLAAPPPTRGTASAGGSSVARAVMGARGRRRLAAALVTGGAALAFAAPAAAAGALDQIRARGELRWGADEQGGEPYAYEDPAPWRRAGRLRGRPGRRAGPRAGVRARCSCRTTGRR